MYRLDMSGTKWEIFRAAVDLFAKYGYSKVSMGLIASEVGISASSIYNHFPSKESILNKVFEYMEYYHNQYQPATNELLQYLETHSCMETFQKAMFVFPEGLAEQIDKIRTVVLNAPKGAALLHKLSFAASYDCIRSLLERMLEQDRIEPIDVHVYASLFSHINYSIAVQQSSPKPVGFVMWTRVLALLFDIVTEKAA